MTILSQSDTSCLLCCFQWEMNQHFFKCSYISDVHPTCDEVCEDIVSWPDKEPRHWHGRKARVCVVLPLCLRAIFHCFITFTSYQADKCPAPPETVSLLCPAPWTSAQTWPVLIVTTLVICLYKLWFPLKNASMTSITATSYPSDSNLLSRHWTIPKCMSSLTPRQNMSTSASLKRSKEQASASSLDFSLALSRSPSFNSKMTLNPWVSSTMLPETIQQWCLLPLTYTMHSHVSLTNMWPACFISTKSYLFLNRATFTDKKTFSRSVCTPC